MRAILTADLGNSALKLVVWDASGAPPRPVLRARLASDASLPAALAAFLARAGRLEGAALSSVANAEADQAVREALEVALDGRGEPVLEPGVVNRCREPWTTGVDRLFAVRGAFALGGAFELGGIFEHGLEAALVLDAGTALTVDACRLEEGRPVFLGGAIAPGPGLSAASLAGGAARLIAVEPRPGVPALGRDTRGALEAGIVVGFQGAARELVARIAEEAQLGGAPALLTGGAAVFLDDPGLFPGRRLYLEPDLVQLGLLAAALAREVR